MGGKFLRFRVLLEPFRIRFRFGTDFQFPHPTMQTSPTPLIACFLFALSFPFMTAENATAQEAKKPESLTERISYSYGLMISRQLKERGMEIDLSQFSAAFKNERSVRTQAQLALLAVPELQRIDVALQGQIGQDFRS